MARSDAAVAAGKTLVQAEARETGAVTRKTYMSYMRAGACADVSFLLGHSRPSAVLY
jgi:hypothetical protein